MFRRNTRFKTSRRFAVYPLGFVANAKAINPESKALSAPHIRPVADETMCALHLVFEMKVFPSLIALYALLLEAAPSPRKSVCWYLKIEAQSSSQGMRSARSTHALIASPVAWSTDSKGAGIGMFQRRNRPVAATWNSM